MNQSISNLEVICPSDIGGNVIYTGTNWNFSTFECIDSTTPESFIATGCGNFGSNFYQDNDQERLCVYIGETDFRLYVATDSTLHIDNESYAHFHASVYDYRTNSFPVYGTELTSAISIELAGENPHITPFPDPKPAADFTSTAEKIIIWISLSTLSGLMCGVGYFIISLKKQNKILAKALVELKEKIK